MIGFDPTPYGNKFGAMKDLMTSKTEHQQHKKPRNGFRIEHQKIHPRTDWANRQILKNCEQQTSDLWRATRWFPFYFSESSSIGTSSKSQTHQSFKLQHCAHLAESYPILLFLRKVVVGSSQIHSTRNIGSTHVAREKGRVVTFLLMFRPLSGCP